MKGNGVRWLKELKTGKLTNYANEAAQYGHKVIDQLSELLTRVKGQIPEKFQNIITKVNDTLNSLAEVKGRLNAQFAGIGDDLVERLGWTLDEGVENTVEGSTQKTLSAKQHAIPPPEDGLLVIPENFKSLYKKAPAAKLEIDSNADEIAAMFGGKVAKSPIKSEERAIQKINNDYDGDATRIKDLARNTIIVSEDKVGDVADELKKRGANVKIIDSKTDPLGYSGVNSTIKTSSGLVGETQVNTPAMIYAKEEEKVARLLLGNDTYDTIAEKVKVPGGKGHELYEKWRVLDSSSPDAQSIADQSRSYYESIRRFYAY
jgi:hypothetical protein